METNEGISGGGSPPDAARAAWPMFTAAAICCGVGLGVGDGPGRDGSAGAGRDGAADALCPLAGGGGADRDDGWLRPDGREGMGDGGLHNTTIPHQILHTSN